MKIIKACQNNTTQEYIILGNDIAKLHKGISLLLQVCQIALCIVNIFTCLYVYVTHALEIGEGAWTFKH